MPQTQPQSNPSLVRLDWGFSCSNDFETVKSRHKRFQMLRELRKLMNLCKNFDSRKNLRVSYVSTNLHAYDAFTAPG